MSRWSAGIICLAVLVGACAGGTAPETSAGTTSDTSTTVNSPSRDEPDSTIAEPRGLRETFSERGVTTMTLRSDETGPHPTLTWDTVDGAALFLLAIIDGNGSPYWAWTGTETSVRVGGGNTAELNQTATLHEPMKATIAAVSSEGRLVAISEPTTIGP